ncbi:CLUMA_CG018873, isoform A [Clunio marinus]|uniref:CLUMA_CG018873, isoform A n=1 Tax=Clunio marinus TaxID=568069 RepID=A0A1J1J0C2_9DIPT|nr:CLUMA_CG018873, isoform A [Clunio marinus]
MGFITQRLANQAADNFALKCLHLKRVSFGFKIRTSCSITKNAPNGHTEVDKKIEKSPQTDSLALKQQKENSTWWKSFK